MTRLDRFLVGWCWSGSVLVLILMAVEAVRSVMR
jgi:hypothetical protein